MNLFNRETVVSQSGNGQLILTNFRIRDIYKGNGTSILLENIRSVSIQYKSWPAFIGGAVICLIAAIAVAGLEKPGLPVMLLITGSIFLAIFFLTRRHYLIIASSGKSINVIIKGQNTKKLLDFIDKIEMQVCERKQELFSSGK